MYRQCTDCQSKSFSPTLDPNTRDNIVQWKEWVSGSTPISKTGQTVEIEVKTTSLEKCSASIEKIVSLTEESLHRFCKHTYNIKAVSSVGRALAVHAPRGMLPSGLPHATP